MERVFKIRCSQLSKIMGGTIGLTDKQKEYLAVLETREAGGDGVKPLTPNMKADLEDLRRKRDSKELPDTCKEYLHEWYANENKSVYSKYFQKGLMCEIEAIDFMAQVLEFGVAKKNQEQKENEYMTGSCDVDLPDAIVDVKCSWDVQTLQSNVFGMDKDYEWQGIGYLILWKKRRFILFHGLFDTDESLNFGEEVIYSDMPDNERWIAYQIEFTEEQLAEIFERIKQRVILCREYLKYYDVKVRARMGKINPK